MSWCLAWLWLLAFSEDRLMDCPVGGDAAAQSADLYPAHLAETSSTDEGLPELQLEGEAWRREVAVRLQRYRARRKARAPRYPSLTLPFDAFETWAPVSSSSTVTAARATAASALAAEPVFEVVEERAREDTAASNSHARIVEEPEPYSNVIEFPRSAVLPNLYTNELAEPILDRPRIVEAPEVLLPPPAMGGILIEAAANPAVQASAGSALPIPAAPLGRRLLAGLLDGLVLSMALAAFGAVFYWVNPERPPMILVITGTAVAGALLWAAYEFLFLVYTGSTLGMRLTKLRLRRFDGSPVDRGRRRWRVLGSYLSALSLGLGYLWCVLDEDGLCWHDRMTRTHIS